MEKVNTNQQTSSFQVITGQTISGLPLATFWGYCGVERSLTSKFIRKELSNMSIEEDARAFGRHFEGGWQLGLLVARSVYKRSQAGRPAKSEPVRNKVSCAKFAKMAGVSARTVQFYCDTWALAAEAGHCTPADELSPGAEDPRLSNIDMEDYEFRELWNKCYREVRQRRQRTGNAESATKRQRRSGATSQSQTDETTSAESQSNRGDSCGSDPRAMIRTCG